MNIAFTVSYCFEHTDEDRSICEQKSAKDTSIHNFPTTFIWLFRKHRRKKSDIWYPYSEKITNSNVKDKKEYYFFFVLFFLWIIQKN